MKTVGVIDITGEPIPASGRSEHDEKALVCRRGKTVTLYAVYKKEK